MVRHGWFIVNLIASLSFWMGIGACGGDADCIIKIDHSKPKHGAPSVPSDMACSYPDMIVYCGVSMDCPCDMQCIGGACAIIDGE